MQIDVLIFGGGAAGLWCLDLFRRAGYHAILLESQALGSGQTIQAQGIIHGGGKYALRGVRDFAAVKTISGMPKRWQQSLAGEIEPRLIGTRVLSDRSYLWLPRGSLVARALWWAGMPLIARAGLLATRPQRVPETAWPQALQGSALAVYSLDEPVISTGSFLDSLAAPHRNRIFLYDASTLQFSQEGARVSRAVLRPRAMVFAAGEGNADLLRKAGVRGDLMQRRPLGMVLLRGELPPLFGHCIVRGKTLLTITAAVEGLWQVGGEIAERLAHEESMDLARRRAMSVISRCLPGLDFSRVEIAIHRAVRAEARTNEQKRPSGVHMRRVAPRIVVAWPTKLALAPVLAEEVFADVTGDLKRPAGYDEDLPAWAAPEVACYPWEEAQWFPAR